MVSKIEFVQPVFDYRKQSYQKPSLKKKKSTSFASILETTIRSRSIVAKSTS